MLHIKWWQGYRQIYFRGDWKLYPLTWCWFRKKKAQREFHLHLSQQKPRDVSKCWHLAPPICRWKKRIEHWAPKECKTPAGWNGWRGVAGVFGVAASTSKSEKDYKTVVRSALLCDLMVCGSDEKTGAEENQIPADLYLLSNNQHNLYNILYPKHYLTGIITPQQGV